MHANAEACPKACARVGVRRVRASGLAPTRMRRAGVGASPNLAGETDWKRVVCPFGAETADEASGRAARPLEAVRKSGAPRASRRPSDGGKPWLV